MLGTRRAVRTNQDHEGEKKHLQGWSPLGTKFAMEDEHGFLGRVAADAWLRFVLTKEEFLDGLSSVDVNCPRNVASVIFVVETAVDDEVLLDMTVEGTV